MSRSNVRWLLGGSIVAIVACAPITPEFKQEAATAMPECPHDWPVPARVIPATAPRGVAPGAPAGSFEVVSTGFPVAGQSANIPEFHDCQRLRTWDGKTESYGVLAAVFARQFLDSITDQQLAAGPKVLGVVYLPQGGTYPDLRLTGKMWACVVVQKGVDPKAWIAETSTPWVCHDSNVAALATTPYVVDLHILPPPAGLAGADIPAAARWDWDEGSHKQYIGLRCGEAWCEMGPDAGFATSPGHDPGGTSGPLRPGYAFRSAYDEQKLAEWRKVGAEPPILVAAPNWGIVTPTPELADVAKAAPHAGDWTPVARVHMWPKEGGYVERMNFIASEPSTTGPAATVLLCVTTNGRECVARGRFGLTRRIDATVCTFDGARYWVARIDRPGRPSRYMCVVYRKGLEGVPVPAVVRWRWQATDETIWISCQYGCCETKVRT